MSRLTNETLGPFNENARELAVKFEQVLVDWLAKHMYANRVQLCGGRDEASNGFRMWMQLHLEHVGDSELIDYAGTSCLGTYGKCTKKSEMSRHIDGWISLYDRYGEELSGAHRMLRIMFLDILPDEVKSNIHDEPNSMEKDFVKSPYGARTMCFLSSARHSQRSPRKFSPKNSVAAFMRSRPRMILMSKTQRRLHLQLLQTLAGADVELKILMPHQGGRRICFNW